MAIVFSIGLAIFAILVFREVRETGILRRELRQLRKRERDHEQD